MTPDERYERLMSARERLVTAAEKVWNGEVFWDVEDEANSLKARAESMSSMVTSEIGLAFYAIHDNFDTVSDDEMVPLAKDYLAAAKAGRDACVQEAKEYAEAIREHAQTILDYLDDESLDETLNENLSEFDASMAALSETIELCERN